MSKIILGVDPSYRAFGVVVYDAEQDKIIECHTFRTKKESTIRKTGVGTDDVRRVTDLTNGYVELLRRLDPILIFSETPTGGAMSQKGAKGMAYATGVTTIVPLITGHTVVHVTARDSKKAATGKVDGGKALVEIAVKKRFPGAPFHPETKGIYEHQHDAAATLMAGMLTPYYELAMKGR